MKRIIDGKSYDTDTATLVAMRDNQPYSDGWWGLYQTHFGAFFEVTFDHDGETLLALKTLKDAEAQPLLEKFGFKPLTDAEVQALQEIFGSGKDATALPEVVKK